MLQEIGQQLLSSKHILALGQLMHLAPKCRIGPLYSKCNKTTIEKIQNVFVWVYKDLKGIPPHLVQHWIEFNTNIPTSHQARYRMNSDYVVVVKQDLDKFLAIGFIAPMEEATWHSPIVVV